jgi:hypothetical protein
LTKLAKNLAGINTIKNDSWFFECEFNCIRSYIWDVFINHYEKYGNLDAKIPYEDRKLIYETNKGEYEYWINEWKTQIGQAVGLLKKDECYDYKDGDYLG